ncbi:MAG TPA: hypothetical protein VF982_07675 [Anaerolineales bacterium]
MLTAAYQKIITTDAARASAKTLLNIRANPFPGNVTPTEISIQAVLWSKPFLP